MKNNYKLLVRKKKKYVLRKNEKNKWKYFLIILSIASIFIISLYFIFFRKIFKESEFNNSFFNSTLVDYINGNIYWNNETSLNMKNVNEEINNIPKLNISFENRTDFYKREKPKVSVVITIHNQENNIMTIYRCVYAQELKDIEIIFVDDASTDNSASKIKELMNKDKRIVYLKNEVNKRTLLSRFKGILNAKGEYIIIIDPDDFLINNILIKAYTAAKKYDLDIVQFYVMIGTFESHTLWTIPKYKDDILKNNTQVRNHFYKSDSRNLWDKLVRREAYIKSVNFMKSEFKNELYYINNDDTAIFGLIHVAESYGFLEQIGYLYILRPSGVYNYRFANNNTNLIFRSIFNNMRYFYLQSENNTIEKTSLAYKYFSRNINDFKHKAKYLTEGLDFILGVLDLYLNSKFFDDKKKAKLNEVKFIFIDRKKNITNS